MIFMDYTMINIKNIRLTKTVSSVPEGGIWWDSKFVGCADAILNYGISQTWFKLAEMLGNQTWDIITANHISARF